MNTVKEMKRHRKKVSEYLESYIDELEDSRGPDNDVEEKLLPLVKQGKMVRAFLISRAYSFFRDDQPEDILKAGGAVELAHTGLLIQDDVIDRDTMRRGMAAIHVQYRQQAEQSGHDEPGHYGESMANCLGDTAFFLGFRLLCELEASGGISRKVCRHYCEALADVGLGEMRDIEMAFSNREVSKEEVLEMYRQKTARYTFSLPLAIGAELAGEDSQTVSTLKSIGEDIGVIFQIKDDELGLFGDPEKTGKPVGSDLEEKKKTLHLLHLLESLDDTDRELVRDRLSGEVSEQEREEILELMHRENIREDAELMMKQLRSGIEKELEDSDLPEEARLELLELTDFCMNRKR